MKLKNSVINKLSKMSKEELFELINNLCDSNDEVVSYLNNVLTNTKVDANKYIAKIEKCFEGCNFKVDKAMDIYLTLRKTTIDYNALSQVGLCLLNELIFDFGLGNFSESRFKRISKISSLVCEDISKATNNEEYRREYEALLLVEDEYLYEELIETYYIYFESRLDDEFLDEE